MNEFDFRRFRQQDELNFAQESARPKSSRSASVKSTKSSKKKEILYSKAPKPSARDFNAADDTELQEQEYFQQQIIKINTENQQIKREIDSLRAKMSNMQTLYDEKLRSDKYFAERLSENPDVILKNLELREKTAVVVKKQHQSQEFAERIQILKNQYSGNSISELKMEVIQSKSSFNKLYDGLQSNDSELASMHKKIEEFKLSNVYLGVIDQKDMMIDLRQHLNKQITKYKKVKQDYQELLGAKEGDHVRLSSILDHNSTIRSLSEELQKKEKIYKQKTQEYCHLITKQQQEAKSCRSQLALIAYQQSQQPQIAKQKTVPKFTVYVSPITENTTMRGLKLAFGEFSVQAVEIKGDYAILKFPLKRNAQNAIDRKNGSSLSGKQILVSWDEPKTMLTESDSNKLNKKHAGNVLKVEDFQSEPSDFEEKEKKAKEMKNQKPDKNAQQNADNKIASTKTENATNKSKNETESKPQAATNTKNDEKPKAKDGNKDKNPVDKSKEKTIDYGEDITVVENNSKPKDESKQNKEESKASKESDKESEDEKPTKEDKSDVSLVMEDSESEKGKTQKNADKESSLVEKDEKKTEEETLPKGGETKSDSIIEAKKSDNSSISLDADDDSYAQKQETKDENKEEKTKDNSDLSIDSDSHHDSKEKEKSKEKHESDKEQSKEDSIHAIESDHNHSDVSKEKQESDKEKSKEDTGITIESDLPKTKLKLDKDKDKPNFASDITLSTLLEKKVNPKEEQENHELDKENKINESHTPSEEKQLLDSDSNSEKPEREEEPKKEDTIKSNIKIEETDKRERSDIASTEDKKENEKKDESSDISIDFDDPVKENNEPKAESKEPKAENEEKSSSDLMISMASDSSNKEDNAPEKENPPAPLSLGGALRSALGKVAPAPENEESNSDSNDF